MTEQVLRTLMRTTDVVVAGFFSPAAIAAVGLGDMYGRLVVRFGLGIGDGTIALTSQDTGSSSLTNRDEAVTQGLLLAILCGIPFVVFGLFASYWAIAILGAEAEVVRLGGLYLAIIMIGAPPMLLTFVGARAIQGTGDTKTPMLINIIANLLNIVLTILLAFGLGPFPDLSILGIALATVIGETTAALMFIIVIYGGRNPLSIVRPTDFVITRQLVQISLPRMAESLEILAEFPFNAILLAFGTEVNAAYHIGRRLYQQIASPLSRGYGVAANVMVGQALGRPDDDRAYTAGWSIASLSVITIGALSIVLFSVAESFVRIFTRDPLTISYGTAFARSYAVAMVFIAAYIVLAGSLRGGSETLTPFIAKMIGAFVFLLGVTYVGGVYFGMGVLAVYIAIVIDFAWRTGFVGFVYYRRRWMDRGRSLMLDRGSLTRGEVTEDTD